MKKRKNNKRSLLTLIIIAQFCYKLKFSKLLIEKLDKLVHGQKDKTN